MTTVLDIENPVADVTGNMPQVVFETSTAPPLSPSPAWTDELPRLMSCGTNRGKSFELDDIQPGAITAQFLNTDRRFDPNDPRLLLPFMRVRCAAQYGTTTYGVWDGFADTWTQLAPDQSNRYAVTQLDGTDIFKFLALNPVQARFPLIIGDPINGVIGANRIGGLVNFTDVAYSGDRVDAVLDLLDVPAAMRDVDRGDVVVIPDQTTVDDTMLSYLRSLNESEYGRLHAAADGRLAFWGRHHWYATDSQRESQLTLTDQPGGLGYAAITIEPADARTIRNRVERANKVMQNPMVAYDQTSIAQYGVQLDSATDLLTESSTDMLNLAQHILAKYKDPVSRVSSVTVNPQSNPSVLFPKVLGLDLGDRITIERQIAGIGAVDSTDYWIESIAHAFTPATWLTTWQLSPADPADHLFVIGSSRIGGPDVIAF